jgi:DNA-binding CsgD family transcriptional regulator
MPHVVLSEEQQRALRSLIAADPVPGSPLPHPRLLEQLAVLIPCEDIGVAVADRTGHLVEVVDRPRSHAEDDEDLQRWLRRFLSDGVVDALLLTVRNGPDRVVQLAMDRRGTRFTSRDVALLRLLEPALERLFRERPAPHLPPHLTVQERRVLRLVALGQSNAQIADRLGVAPATVRKHLEHIFPKLGVTSRLAAAAAFDGRTLPDPDQVPLVERYA